MNVTPNIKNSLLAILLTLLFGKWLIYSAGRAFGWYLRRKTSSRRKSIFKRVKIEEEAVDSFYGKKLKREKEDGDKVESYRATPDTNVS